MNKSILHRLTRFSHFVCFISLMIADDGRAGALTLTDFGHGQMRTGSRPSTGLRPLVVVMVDFETAPPFAHSSAYYDGLYFSPAHPKGVQGYFDENSRGRFNWTRAGAGVVGPVRLLASDRAKATKGFEGFPYDSNMVFKVMASEVFDFHSYDQNGDQLITPDELTIAFVSNDQWGEGNHYLGANRSWVIPCPGGDYSTTWQVFLNHRSALDVVCHELTHALGAVDLYNSSCPSINLTLMSCSTGIPDGTDSMHLDPWHKMRLGWCEPRLRTLGPGGIEELPAAQLMTRPDAPVLLYDPSKGSSDYFLIEYRTPFLPGTPFESYFAYTTNGVVIWHVSNGLQPGVNVLAEGAPNLTRGDSHAWPAGALTPLLTWGDGTLTRTRLLLHEFSRMADRITVEWISEGDIWVEFGGKRFVEEGTFENPFSSLSPGLAAVPHGGVLKFKPGARAEVATINKRVRLEAHGGTVTIGR